MGYFESLDSNIKLEPAPVGVSFSTLEYSHDSFLDNIKNNVFSPTKIKSIIASNIPLYFDYTTFTDSKTRVHMQSIWTNIEFLTNVLALLNEDQKFRQKVVYGYSRDVNIIASDYLKVEKDERAYEKDSAVAALLFDIACNVNAEYIVQLSSKIHVDIAKMLCLSNFSTLNMRDSKYQLIEMIWRYGDYGNVLSIEQIIYVFYVFYKDNFGDLFTSLMTHKYIDADGVYKQIDDNISSALINILNSMSSTEIREVLAKYSNYLSFFSGTENCSLRFSLKHLPAEFKNVAECVLEGEKLGYYVP